MTKQSNACAKLSEEDLKAALIKAWEQAEQNTREKMAPLLYYLHKKLLARGQKGKGFERWVDKELGIAVRTARRWVSWYAEQIGEKPPKEKPPKEKPPGVTIGQVAESEDEDEDDEVKEIEYEEEEQDPDGRSWVSFQILLTESEDAQFRRSMSVLAERFSEVVFAAVTNQAAELAGPLVEVSRADNSASASV
jgi:hypothetical protein